jgi:hypothetical protein
MVHLAGVEHIVCYVKYIQLKYTRMHIFDKKVKSVKKVHIYQAVPC